MIHPTAARLFTLASKQSLKRTRGHNVVNACRSFCCGYTGLSPHMFHKPTEERQLHRSSRGQMMKAAVVDSHGDEFKIREVPRPNPGPSEVLIKIIRSGLCHTDLHAADGDWPVKSKLPLIAGHEGVGVVTELGSNVTDLKVGDRVGVAWLHSACGRCEDCVNGKETLCQKQQMSGYSVDGGFAEYTLGEASHVARIPDALSFTQAAPIMCAGVTTYKGLKMTETRPGQFCTIIGAAGGLGHIAIQYARAMGMRVIAVDMPDKLDFCRELGAEAAFKANDSKTIDKIVQYTNGGSHGILCVAASQGAFDTSINICRRGGTMVLIGLPKGAIPVPVFDTVLRGLTVRGSIVGTRTDLAEALDFAARGEIKCNIETCKFTDIQKAVNRLKQGKVLGRFVLDVAKDEE